MPKTHQPLSPENGNSILAVRRVFRVGGPAVVGSTLRPEALRPRLSAGVPLSYEGRYLHSAISPVNVPEPFS